jgi:tetratricopeptide (TPR) repeat protein/tRNA A-37 threonylcarbamoyl transferase component Bud32
MGEEDEAYLTHAVQFERGAEVGRYVVLSQLGSGGMGIVYSAYDPELDRKIALKVLHPSRASGARREAARARLLREAQALARVSHPNVITVHDVGTIHGSVFVAMEFIDGRTLTKWTNKKPRTWNRVLDVMIEAGQGLAAAHQRGLVHRDFKPDNVMLGRDGRIVVLDFGLAREAGAEVSSEPTPDFDDFESRDEDSNIDETLDDATLKATAVASSLSLSLTRTGGVLGTPAYMAPEQHVGLTADARGDQFSFCVTLYEALYLRRPFKGNSRATLAVEVTEGNVLPAPSDTDVPGWVHRVLLRGLEANPDERFESMDALLTELGQSHDERSFGRRRGLLLGAAGLLVASAGLYVVTQNDESQQVCRGADRHLAGVWDAARQTKVGEAFAATKLPFAERVLDQVSPQLDAYVRSWTQQRTEACEATRVHGEQSQTMLDRRMLCLDQSLTQFDALVEQLAVADSETVEHASAAVNSLPPVDRCADIETLMFSGAALDPAQRDAVDAFEHLYAAAKAKEDIGRHDAARQAVAIAVDHARSMGHPASLARALLLSASIQTEDRKHADAESTLFEAYAQAELAQEPRLRAQAAILMTRITGATLARARDGRNWAGMARAAIERAGGDSKLEADLAQALGDVCLREDRFELAENHYLEARELREQTLGPDDPSVVDSIHDLGVVAQQRSNFEAALRHFQRAADTRQDKLGPVHPAVADELRAVARVYFDLNRYDESLELLERVTRIYEGRYGPQHPKMADLLNQRATVLDYDGRSNEALTLYRRQLKILEAAAAPDSLDLAPSHVALGNVLSTMRLSEEARKHYEKALGIQRTHLGEDHPDVGRTWMNIGRTYYFDDDFSRALDYYQRTVNVWQTTLGRDHVLMGFVYVNMADVYEYQHDWDACIEWNQRAIEIYRPAYGEDHGQIAYAIGGVCRCRVGKGEGAQAIPTCERGLEMQRRFRIEQADAARIELGLAQAVFENDENAGVTHGRNALEAFRSELPAGAREIGEAKRWLEGVAG